MEFAKRFEELGLCPALILPDREPISYGELARRIADMANRFGSEKKRRALIARQRPDAPLVTDGSVGLAA